MLFNLYTICKASQKKAVCKGEASVLRIIMALHFVIKNQCQGKIDIYFLIYLQKKNIKR